MEAKRPTIEGLQADLAAVNHSIQIINSVRGGDLLVRDIITTLSVLGFVRDFITSILEAEKTNTVIKEVPNGGETVSKAKRSKTKRS